MAESRDDADDAFDRTLNKYEAKYPKAMHSLQKDRQALLAFYRYPAKHWQHIRTTNPIESTFATVRLRTDQTRNCVSSNTILAMVFKLAQSAEKRWQRIRGFRQLGDVIEGVPFQDGIKVNKNDLLGFTFVQPNLQSLNDVTVGKNVHIQGDFNAEKGQIGELMVNGDANLKNLTISHEITINGDLSTMGSQFNNSLSLYAKKATVTNSTLSSIVFKPYQKDKPQTLYLTKGSHVNGDITFANNKGTIYLSDNSSIQGVVKGGEVKPY